MRRLKLGFTKQTRSENFELNFYYPTEIQRDQLKIVHRDISTNEKMRLDTRQRELSELIEDIDSGRLRVENLDKKIRDKLRLLLRGKV